MGINDFGEMTRLAKMVRPDYFVITKISYSHIDALHDLDGVLRAKTETIAFMKSDGIVILNGDDELLWDYDPGIKRIMYGLMKRNDIIVENIRHEGTSAIFCDVINSDERYSVNIPAYGAHIAELLGAAATIGFLFGLTGADIAHGLLSYAPIERRANVISTGRITLIDDCYNANPNSMKAALTSLSSLTIPSFGRRVAILGDMLNIGDASDELHRQVGELAARSSLDLVVCCGENALIIFKSYTSSGGDNAHYFPSKELLVPNLKELIKENDTVLVKASNGMAFDEITYVLQAHVGDTPLKEECPHVC
jgi:UDP-N-acetylmuramoyl-tripeptide--D-alanyl-D-alanine ligase